MCDFVLQMILARRSPDDEGWMNLLFVIVMAVIWIVGGVIKAMKTRAEEQQRPRQAPSPKSPAGRGQRQQVSGRPQRPAGAAQAAGKPSGAAKKRVTLADLREAARRIAAEAEQAFQGQTKPTPRPKPTAGPPPAPTPPVPPATPPVVGPAIGMLGAPSHREAPEVDGVELSPSRQVPDLLSDYADPDKLKTAILHYEILGPPLSLRDQWALHTS